MTTPLFGTDGIRGLANEEPMTATTALKVAQATGGHFRNADRRHVAVIGKDTRLSGYMLEPALVAGLVSVGIDVVLVGPLPTPAIAMLTRSLRAAFGIMISASHNPYQDNGIKLFGPDGYKLSDEVEAKIAAEVIEDRPPALAAPDQLGRAKRLDDAAGRYIEFVKASFPRGLRLDGLKVVVDCAHGAAYKVAPTVLWELGAEVVPIGVQPDGFNINKDSGAVHVAELSRQVIAHGADLGIALDGDQIMALIASSWSASGRLHGRGLVATVMSNLGLERHLETLGLKLVRTKVGDRYVVEEMRRAGFNVGGEQSGHIILSDYATTGDGLIAALQFLAVVIESGQRASAVARVFTPFPQILKNVRFGRTGKPPLEQAAVKATIANAEQRLGTRGRLVVRPSGTERVIRVMAEGDDDAVVGGIVDEIADAIRRAAG